MKTKFLTTEERKIIQSFLENGVPTSKLEKLRREKNEELIKCLDSQVPNQTITWRNLIKRENGKIDCPLNEFLMTLSSLISDPELPNKIKNNKHYLLARDSRLSLLAELDIGLSEHRYPCNCCPAR